MSAQRGECRDLQCREYPTGLEDLLGHDHLGHQARNILAREGVTPEQLQSLPDARLLEFENFGRACLARVRAAVPAPPLVPASADSFSFRGGSPS
jgi:hypothetical protein